MSSFPDNKDRELDDGEEVLRMFLMTQEAQSPKDDAASQQQRPMEEFLFPQDDSKQMEESRKALQSFHMFWGRIGGL